MISDGVLSIGMGIQALLSSVVMWFEWFFAQLAAAASLFNV
jgi:hypothetical protein